MNRNTTCRFERIVGSEDQIRTLYELLKRRAHPISHISLPSYEVHSRFVAKHPYLHWFLVQINNDVVGAFYIKRDNSIGFNIEVIEDEIIEECLCFIKKNYSPQISEASVTPDFFYINVAVSNNALRKHFEERKLQAVQISFRI